MLAVIGLAPVAASAQPSPADRLQAEVLFNDGKKLLKDGQIAEACRKFEGSYRILNWLGAMARWDVRDAIHVDYSVPFAYDSLLWRLTVGARVDINDNIAIKAEYLHVQPFGRMSEGLEDMKDPSGMSTAGDYAADYLTSSLVLRY